MSLSLCMLATAMPMCFVLPCCNVIYTGHRLHPLFNKCGLRQVQAGERGAARPAAAQHETQVRAHGQLLSLLFVCIKLTQPALSLCVPTRRGSLA